MTEEREIYNEARARKAKQVEETIDRFIANKYAWGYGFNDGWNEAMTAKFDDRDILTRWRQESRHTSCQCNEEEYCDVNCPHGRMYMSGFCVYCQEVYKQMDKEMRSA